MIVGLEGREREREREGGRERERDHVEREEGRMYFYVLMNGQCKRAGLQFCVHFEFSEVSLRGLKSKHSI